MDAKTVKATIKSVLGIAVRVSTVKCKARWVEARIVPDNMDAARLGQPLTYSVRFPAAFGNACLRAVYGDGPIASQDWAGNVMSHMIAMLPHEWDSAFAIYAAKVAGVGADDWVNRYHDRMASQEL